MDKEVKRISLGEGEPDIIVEEYGDDRFDVKQPVYVREYGYLRRNVSAENLDKKIEQVKNEHPYFIGRGDFTLEIPKSP